MDRSSLLRKIEATLDEAAHSEFWGSIEIELRKGVPVLLKKHSSEKLNPEENPRATRPYR